MSDATADMLEGIIASGAKCPLCGWTRPHEHTPTEITIYRNGVKYGRGLSGLPDLLSPTPAMIEAGAQRLVSWEDGSTWPDSWTPLQVAVARNEAERVWRSMRLACSPTTDEGKQS